MNASWLGSVPYRQALELQHSRHREVEDGAPDRCLGLEHPTVVTLGVRGRPEEDLLPGAQDWDVVITDRGGQATLHSPGQLVIYPVIDLRRRHWGAREFVGRLLGATVRVLEDEGIKAVARDDRAGVYVNGAKIAFCGLRIERGISRHGLSLNVSNDLKLFESIRPCGFSGEKLTCWTDFKPAPLMENLFKRWVSAFESGK